ncbi:alpha/beta hydrolase, partial [Phenylobacterium sp.]|uniref:alpha/beta fold hydrolase n=1 Tax=Phenylobacterium sp. TaxID=1871053 RepID=UPI0012129907
MTVRYQTVSIDDVEVFYREAGPVEAPVILLLHGFPTSSHMFRDLIPRLSRSYRLIAPDLPGFGQTVTPPRGEFSYTFDNLAQVVGRFTDVLGLSCYALYVFDYGAPVGFRLAMARPERVTAIICQNGNAYLEGLHPGWATWENYWRSPSPETREACRESLAPDTIRNFQYLRGTDPTLMSPDNMMLDLAYLARPGAADIQLDLILDYRSNVALYPAVHAYFRTEQPPFLIVWGKNDASFRVEGALAFKTDLPKVKIELLDTGHFALETHG